MFLRSRTSAVALGFLAVVVFPQEIFCAGAADIPAARERAARADLLALQEMQIKLYKSLADEKLSEAERSRRLAEHTERYENFLLAFPDNAAAEILYAKFLRDIGDDEYAKKLFEKAGKSEPENASVHQQIGAIFAETGNFEAAFPHLKKAVEISPGTPEYQFQFGEFLATFRARLLEKKIFPDRDAIDSEMQDAFRACVAIAPKNKDFRLRYALSFYEVEKPNWREAIQLWEQILPETPSQEEAKECAKLDKVFVESVNLHKARVCAELGIFADAEKLLARSKSPKLERSREEVKKIILKKKQESKNALRGKDGNRRSDIY